MSKDDFTEFDAWWNNVRDPRDFVGYFEARDAWTAALASRQEQPVPDEREDSPAVQGAWNKFNALVSDGPDSPFPGMAKAFESSYGQAWDDKDWRNETSIWASAWKAAWQARAALAAPSVLVATVPEAMERNYTLDDYSIHDHYAQGWNDCRDKMIAAAPSPEGDKP